MEKNINVYVKGKRYAVPLKEIIYMEKALRKIEMHTKRGIIVFYGKYCDIEPELDKRFAFCHRSFVLNMDEIRCLSKDEIIMSNDDVIRFGLKCFQRLAREYKEYVKS